MTARTVAVRPGVAAVVGVQVVALAAAVVVPAPRFGWWPAAVITAVAAVPLGVRVYGRNAAGWVRVWARWWWRRRRGLPVAAAVDVPHGALVCGVRVQAHQAITMIRVAGRAYAPTLLRGASVSLTTNVLPLEVLAGLLDQPGGLHLARIDIVSCGHRVRRASGYPPLYSTLLADRPAAGQRSTALIVRLDLAASVPGLSYRYSVGASAAPATERLINALGQHGVRAAALSAGELDVALAELGAGLVAAPEPAGHDAHNGQPREDAGVPQPVRRPRWGGAPRPASAPEPGWRAVHTRAGYLSSYYFSAGDITTASLNQMWALRSDEVVQTTSLWKPRDAGRGGDDPVLVSAMVRTCDPQPPPQPPTLHLNPLPGDQYAATMAAAPVAHRPLGLPGRPLTELAELAIPVGATGILVGAASHDDPDADPPVQRDDLVLYALTDPQRATHIAMDTSEDYVRQLLIRAAAVGERIAIYTDAPSRWASLMMPNIAVAEPNRPPPFVASIIVNDQATNPPSAGLAATVITLRANQAVGAATSAPDLRFTEIAPSTVHISTATQSLEVSVVAFRQEQAWTGLAVG